MTASLDLKVNWKNVPRRKITTRGVELACRELGTNSPVTPVASAAARSAQGTRACSGRGARGGAPALEV